MSVPPDLRPCSGGASLCSRWDRPGLQVGSSSSSSSPSSSSSCLLQLKFPTMTSSLFQTSRLKTVSKTLLFPRLSAPPRPFPDCTGARCVQALCVLFHLVSVRPDPVFFFVGVNWRLWTSVGRLLDREGSSNSIK